MIISLFLLILIIGAVWLSFIYEYQELGWVLSAILISTFVINLIAWSLIRMDSSSLPERVNAVQCTVETQRNSEYNTELEKVFMTQDIMSMNIKIKSMQYWNNTWLFDDYISDNVDNLQLIE